MALKVVAEIGVNFRTLDEAKQMIVAAKAAGAYAVKFQLFNNEVIKDSPYEVQLRELILDENCVATLHDCAKENKILFALTPMYMEAMKMVEKHADIIKIRYADHENSELIGAAMDAGKTVLLSVPRPPLDPRMMFNPRLYPMYCIPRYPPEPEDMNLDVACVCRGFSSHYPYTAPDLAFAINRTYEDSYLEKHVMLNVIETRPPIDVAVSISFTELTTLIRQLKLIERLKRTRLT